MRALLQICLFVFALGASDALAAESVAALCARTAKDGNVAACRAAVAEDGRDLARRKNLALAYLADEDGENCFRTHAEIVALAPEDADSHFGYAVALATFGRYEAAVPLVRTAMRLNPQDLATVQLAALLFETMSRHEEAFAAFRQGAELGDPRLMFDLALAYESGRGTAPDRRAAFGWFEKAAQAGHVTAMLRVAEMYRDGDAVAVDAARAEFWARRARSEGIGN